MWPKLNTIQSQLFYDSSPIRESIHGLTFYSYHLCWSSSFSLPLCCVQPKFIPQFIRWVILFFFLSNISCQYLLQCVISFTGNRRHTTMMLCQELGILEMEECLAGTWNARSSGQFSLFLITKIVLWIYLMFMGCMLSSTKKSARLITSCHKQHLKAQFLANDPKFWTHCMLIVCDVWMGIACVIPAVELISLHKSSCDQVHLISQAASGKTVMWALIIMLGMFGWIHNVRMAIIVVYRKQLSAVMAEEFSRCAPSVFFFFFNIQWSFSFIFAGCTRKKCWRN